MRHRITSYNVCYTKLLRSGYLAYLASIIDEVLALARDAGVSVRRILDWGSGPVAVASSLLRERGFEVYSYDPLYAPRVPDRKDYVV